MGIKKLHKFKDKETQELQKSYGESCKNCEGMYHQKCTKLTKDVLEKEAKYIE